MKGTLVKTFVLLILLLAGYYFLFLGPKLAFPNKLLQTEERLAKHHSSLLQNRLSFVELTKLDPNSASFNLEKSSLVATVKETNEEGLNALKKQSELPKIDNDLNSRYESLLEETRSVYEDQERLLEKVFATDSYQAGVGILKSDESIKILTKQTNLILEYDFWLKKINEIQIQD
jgi:hypothetical protein